ncbi:MAG: hypothetical protein HY078_13750 [Elusimicrobia bacterium]|nr:hypothetical protein [Elusimicrobiota bacterium]
MIREIKHDGELVAIIISHDHDQDGLNFVTDKAMTLQMGYMKYPKGYRILPHVHHPVERKALLTLEAIVVKSGRIIVDLYSKDRKHIGDVELQALDSILFVSGGHGFKFLEVGELLEVKQGPCVPPEQDKAKFHGAHD